ncbi:hypothetical protein SADUNF_Sadunf01G0147400 [Salix dunnii]|uniref:AP2/ERF domain-containing protein n=1 Tax=Salix dunnii TaxID=1413687 RepID=A0A835TKL0_9ROSI|nr:hypothetical protein SADUNF_Sadunf01G0147400 [Salix dunnii]
MIGGHRWTGRYLWCMHISCPFPFFLFPFLTKNNLMGFFSHAPSGGYDKEEKAARAYDLAAWKYWCPTTHINFPVGTYEKELEEMEQMTRQDSPLLAIASCDASDELSDMAWSANTGERRQRQSANSNSNYSTWWLQVAGIPPMLLVRNARVVSPVILTLEAEATLRVTSH